MRLLTDAEAEEFWDALERDNPRPWIRSEVTRLVELLQTHVSMALESGTEPARVVALLKRVRAAILDARGES